MSESSEEVNRDNLSMFHLKSDVFHESSRKCSIKDYFQVKNNENKVNKMIQTNICEETQSLKSWKIVAEYKREELATALEENKRLYEIKAMLDNENAQYKLLLNEANSFIDVFKELVQDTANDTGIEVNELENGD